MEEVSRLEQVVASELDIYEAMDPNDYEKRQNEAKVLCQLIDKSIEEIKINNASWEAEYKCQKEMEILESKHKHEIAMQEMLT